MKNLDIRSRVLLAALLPATLLAVALAALFLFDRLGVLNDAYRQKAEAMARQIVAGSEYGLFSGNREALQVLIERAAREEDVRAITLFDAADRIVVSAGAPRSGIPPDNGAEGEFLTELPGNVMLLRRTIWGADLPLDDLFREGSPPSRTRLGQLILELSTDRIANRARQLQLTWILITTVFLMFGVILAVYLSRGVIRPIVQVADVVARIGQGDLAARVSIDANGPLRHLEEGLNKMAAHIESGQDELQSRIMDATASLRQHQEHLTELVRERTAQLLAMSIELTKIEERERQAVAQDLHDGLGQILAVARLKLSVLDTSPDNNVRLKSELQFIEGLIDEANRSVRTLSLQLSPSMPKTLELAPALEWLAENMRRSFGLHVDVNIVDLPQHVDAAILSTLLRATRELLVNVARHSQALVAELSTMTKDDRMIISVTDSGIGFDPQTLSKPSADGGFGLFSVRERIGYIGGELYIDSSLGDGTVAVLSVPIKLIQQVQVTRE
ncbi:MAG: histidine kinase [Proteobacteria bacterium]|nr:histidine kinase [Pseudomonadota bacterium]